MFGSSDVRKPGFARNKQSFHTPVGVSHESVGDALCGVPRWLTNVVAARGTNRFNRLIGPSQH